MLRDATETVKFNGAVPDVVAYLQGETELTRSTIVRIITESKRLPEFLLNPQKYMDAVSAILKQQLHKLIIDGIKYEKLGNAEYEMRLFEDEEIMSYEQVPFQFSLHVVHKAGAKPEHRKFLAEGRNDPRADFMLQLRTAIEPSGSIVVFNASFEKSRLKECAEVLPG